MGSVLVYLSVCPSLPPSIHPSVPSIHPWVCHISLNYNFSLWIAISVYHQPPLTGRTCLCTTYVTSQSLAVNPHLWLQCESLPTTCAYAYVHMHMCMHGRAGGTLHIFALVYFVFKKWYHTFCWPTQHQQKITPNHISRTCNQLRSGLHIGCSSAHRPRSRSPSQSIHRCWRRNYFER